MLPTYIAIDQAVRTLEQTEMCETFALWQMRLVLELCESRVLQHRLREGAQGRGLLLSSEFLPVMKNSADGTLDRWLTDNSHVLRSYMSGQSLTEDMLSNMLACFLVYHSIPCLSKMSATHLEGSTSFPELLLKFSQLGIPVRALLRLGPLLLGTAGFWTGQLAC